MRLGIVTDAHLCPPGTPPDGCHNPYAYDRAEMHLASAIEDLCRDNIDLLAVLGDLTNGGDQSSMTRAVELIRASTTPVHVVAGNHDRDVDPELLASLVNSSGLEMANPAGEAIKGLRIAGVQITAERDGGWTISDPDIAAWGDEPTVLFSHIPLLDRENVVRAADLKYAGGLVDGDSIIEALMLRRAPTIVIHGHLHLRDACAAGPVLQIGCASLIEPPYERAVIDIHCTRGECAVRSRHRSVAPIPDVRLPVLSPAESSWLFASRGWKPVGRDA